MSVRVSDMIQVHKMLAPRVMEDPPFEVFLSLPITMPKCNSPKDCLVVDLSTLSRFMFAIRFRMVTMAQV